MKQLLAFFLLIMVGWACRPGGSNGNTPVGVSKSYFKAINKGDFKEARQYVVKDYYRILDRVEKNEPGNPGPKTNAELVDEYYELMMEEDGVAIVATGAKVKDSNVRVDYDLWLVKKDGRWLISEVVPKDQ